MEGARPASTSSYFARPRPARLLLRVHSAEGLRHVSAAGAYCKLYVGAVEMVRGSRHYRQSLGRSKSRGALSASASAHSLSRLLHSPGLDTDLEAAGDGRVQVRKTQVVKGKRPSVVWNEKFDLEVADPAREVLSVRVKSARLMASPAIGACAVSLRLLPGVTVDRWVDLMDGRKPAGRIRLQLRLVDDDAAGAAHVADPMSHSWPSPVAGNGFEATASTGSSRPETAASTSPTLLITPIPGTRPAPGSARRYRESRRKRELSIRGLAASQIKAQPPSPQDDPDQQQEDRHRQSRRTSEDNLSGMDYERNSAPTADSAPATTRVSFNSFVHTPSSPGMTPPQPRASQSSQSSHSPKARKSSLPLSSPASSPVHAPVQDPDSDSDHVAEHLPPAPMAQSAASDRGTMTMDELDKSRLHMSALGPPVEQRRRKARKPSVAPRESSRVHFDSDSDSDYGDLSDDDNVVAVHVPNRTYSPQQSVVIFEDDEEVVRAQQEKLRLTDRTTASAGTPSVISVAASDFDLDGNRSHSTGPEDDSDVDSDDEEEDYESDEEPRIPLNASLTKLLCRFSANVLIEDEDEDDEDEDDDVFMGGMDDFVPIMDFAEHAPVDDIDCA